KARALLDASPHFRRYWDNGYFTLYHLTGASDWIEAQGATARLLERTPHRWTIAVDESEPGAQLTLKMGHYPLWRAAIVTPSEQALSLTANPYGLQTVALPPGGPYTLQVVYRAGWLEWSGLALSLASLSLAAGLVAARVARALRPPCSAS
ncbi:MAG TPA: hypothetical protein VNK95_10095, partial [Caldilineaceae bacterium]|nr:hypothetical protein [Caldilineaceae bacterium]